jgi:hypothetical protein
VAEQGESLSIELSKEQVERVLADAAGTGSMTLALSGLPQARAMLAGVARRGEDGRLSGSLLWGLMLLSVFPTDGSYVSNAEVAHALGMTPSTAHRYISTLVAAGLLERNPRTRKYRLANAG